MKILILSLSALLSFAAYFADPDYPEIEKQIALGAAEHIKTEVNFSAGFLSITGESLDNLMEGKYRFYKDNKPRFYYEETNNMGYLEISDNGFDFNLDEDNKTRWDIELNKNTTQEINIDMGAGEADIDLEDSNLKRFKFDIGAGEAHINLKNTSIPKVYFYGKAGEAHIDLSGEWHNDLEAEITGGVGELHITLPDNVGIEMDISGLLGERQVPGFYKDGSRYTNRLLGKTDYTLYLEVVGGIGTVNIQTAHE